MLTNNDQTATDQQLIERSLAGHQEAFGQLVRKYQDKLFTSLSHLTGSHADAEDVAQDAFVQAYFKLSTFRQHCAFYTWLYRIALNSGVHPRPLPPDSGVSVAHARRHRGRPIRPARDPRRRIGTS